MRWHSKFTQALNSVGKAVNGSRILMLGLAYKKNVDDIRESPSVEIMDQLRELGAAVEYCDPFFPVWPGMRHYDFDLASRDFDEATLREFDCVVIGTDHDLFDYALVQRAARLVVDTRGRIRQPLLHVFRA